MSFSLALMGVSSRWRGTHGDRKGWPFGRWFLLLLPVISLTPILPAREKTDVVVLKNGDRIRCEIKSLARGMLTVKTDSMSTVDIKWQDVVSIDSTFLFTLQDSQGQTYVGSLQAIDGSPQVKVTGSKPADGLMHSNVVSIQAIEGHWSKRLSGSADLGYDYTKASDRTQFNFSGDLAYRTEVYSGQLTYTSTLGTSNGEKDADRKITTITGTHQIKGKWLVYSQMSHEKNFQLQLDRRFSFLGGPGYRIAQSNRSLVTVIGATAFTRESYYGQDLVINAEGFIGLDTQFFKLYSPKFDIVNQLVFLPNFTTWGRLRAEFNSKLRIELLKDFFVSFTFFDSFDSRPPSATAAKNDYGFTTGLSWSFRR